MKCKCPPSVLQVPAEGGLPTLESFLAADVRANYNSTPHCFIKLKQHEYFQVGFWVLRKLGFSCFGVGD